MAFLRQVRRTVTGVSPLCDERPARSRSSCANLLWTVRYEVVTVLGPGLATAEERRRGVDVAEGHRTQADRHLLAAGRRQAEGDRAAVELDEAAGTAEGAATGAHA